MPPPPPQPIALRELTLLFLRLGLTGFGGPAGHLSLMRTEIVSRKRWMSDVEFLDLIAAANLIPGPNSTEVAIHVGARLGGRRGLLLAGTAFIVPAFLIVLGVAVAYTRYGQTPDARWVLAGVAPVIVAVVLDALRQFARASVTTPFGGVVVAAALLASLARMPELLVLLLAGLGALFRRRWSQTAPAIAPAVGLGMTVGSTTASAVLAAAAPLAAPTLADITLFFLKVGSVLFGSGYVLLAFLQADLVDRWGWLTNQQLLDAIAVGQFTPGPLFTTATFIGYVLGGYSGAVLATAGIFLPAFVFVGLTAPFIQRLRGSAVLSTFLDGVVWASLGLMASVCLLLGIHTLTSAGRIALCVSALVVLVWKRPNSAWLVAAGGCLGWLLRAG